MDARRESEPTPMKNRTTAERKSERELVVTRNVRVGGRYRLVFSHEGSEPMAFYGRYLEVTPHSRLVWTNEEGDDGGAVTTVTFEEQGGKTLLVLHELYPSKEALDGAIASGSTDGMGETFEQLDELVVTLGASVGRS